jgi:hypothetical protein
MIAQLKRKGVWQNAQVEALCQYSERIWNDFIRLLAKLTVKAPILMRSHALEN